MLEDLALQQASGVLKIDGDPDGAVYLERGFITCAQASWTPDAAVRLRATLRPAGEARDLLPAEDRAAHDIGTALVQRDLITRDSLQMILRSVAVDAIIALTVPLPRVSSVLRARFETSGRHWAGTFSRLSVSSVRAEAVARAARMARCSLAHTTPVILCDLEHAPATLSREQRLMIGGISRPVSARDLAWQCGLALYDAVGCIGDLMAAGICVPCADHVGALPSSPAGEPGTGPGTPQVPQQPGKLPRRKPAAGTRWPGAGSSARPGPAGGQPAGAGVTPSSPELLLRVLQGLRKLR